MIQSSLRASPTRAIASSKMGQDKRGNPRVWLEGRKLARSGFTPNARYRMSVDSSRREVTLRLDDDGDRAVSSRGRRGTVIPIVDIVNRQILEPLLAIESLRIDFEAGRIIIRPNQIELRKLERVARTRARILAGEPLQTGSVSTGLGILSMAIHKGLAAAGVASELAWSVEIDADYQDHAAERNPAWDPDKTMAINMPLQEFAFDRSALDQVATADIIEAGIPCTAHSIAGRAKKHLVRPEDDPNAGHLVVGFLSIVASTNPSLIVLENVPQYSDSASFSILTTQLTEWGYDLDWTVLKGADFGCYEHRDRMVLIASTGGISVDLAALAPSDLPSRKLADVLEHIPEDSPLWMEMTYLKEKQLRDMEEGKGFRMQIHDGSSPAVGVLGRGYSKIRSTEAKLRHPTNPDLLRQLTPTEHARVKGIPDSMVAGLPVTVAHEMLGQSILVEPFQALGEGIGRAVVDWAHDRTVVPLKPLQRAAERIPLLAANDRAPSVPAASSSQLSLFG